MAHTDATYRTWSALNNSWQTANQEAREARAKATKALVLCATGQGLGPSAYDLAECERLEQLADNLSAEMEKLIKNAFS